MVVKNILLILNNNNSCFLINSKFDKFNYKYNLFNLLKFFELLCCGLVTVSYRNSFEFLTCPCYSRNRLWRHRPPLQYIWARPYIDYCSYCCVQVIKDKILGLLYPTVEISVFFVLGLNRTAVRTSLSTTIVLSGVS